MLAFVFEEVIEEGQFDIFAVELGGLGVEADVAEGAAFAERPAAVHPRAHDQHVEGAGGTGFDGFVHLERAVQIFGVVPAADGHHRWLDVFQVGKNIARLPESVFGVMLHHGVPERHLIVEVAFVGVAERAEAEKELVAVIGAAVKARAGGNRGGLGELPAGAGKPAEGVGEEKSAVVMPVVGGKPVRDGRLGRDGLERGVRVNQAHGGVKAGIRNAPHADPAVVVGNVFDQPLDGVPGVRAFVEIFRAGLRRLVRAHVVELAFGHPAAADVLVDKDVALLLEDKRGADGVAVAIAAVGTYVVGGADEHEGIALGGIFRDVHGGVETDTVAHGDVVLVFGVVGLCVFEILRVKGCGEGGKERGCEEHRAQ